MNLSTAEPDDFEVSEDHYPTCPFVLDASEECNCEDETRKIREDFKMARYDLERGN